MINDFKKLKLRNWSQIVKDRKAWNDLMQETYTHSFRAIVSEEE